MGKMELIKAVQQACKQWDCVASSAAIEAVRKPDDNASQVRARDYVTRSDACNKIGDEIIDLIHANWQPDDQNAGTA